jgi:cyclopropane fatty-acyl-phospholipid synthase-like methyltransferase
MPCDLGDDPARYLGVIRDAFARHYGECSDVWTADRTMREFPALVHERLGLPWVSRVLDVGCGAGLDVAYFAKVCAAVVGIDLHPHPDWDAIRERAGNVRFEPVDLLGYDPGERYDLVFDNGCFHHQHPAHYGAYLARVTRLLAPDGRYVLSTFKNPDLPRRVDAYGRLHRYFADAELHAVLQGAGLHVADELDVGKGRRDQHGELYRLTFCTLGPR